MKMQIWLFNKLHNLRLQFLIDLATMVIVVADTMHMENEPQAFNQAWNHSNPESQRKWQEAIQNEFNIMKK